MRPIAMRNLKAAVGIDAGERGDCAQIDPQQRAFIDRLDIGRARPLIDEREFTKKIAALERGQIR